MMSSYLSIFSFKLPSFLVNLIPASRIPSCSNLPRRASILAFWSVPVRMCCICLTTRSIAAVSLSLSRAPATRLAPGSFSIWPLACLSVAYPRFECSIIMTCRYQPHSPDAQKPKTQGCVLLTDEASEGRNMKEEVVKHAWSFNHKGKGMPQPLVCGFCSFLV